MEHSLFFIQDVFIKYVFCKGHLTQLAYKNNCVIHAQEAQAKKDDRNGDLVMGHSAESVSKESESSTMANAAGDVRV